MKELKLSVIIPVYNVEKYVEACIESVYRQDLDVDDFEVILINDGSTDHSLEIIQGLAERHHNIKIICQENKGLSITRNNGIKVARGKYIQFIDSDDILIDGTLNQLLNIAIKYNLDILKGDYKKANNEEIKVGLKYENNRKIICTLKDGEHGFIEDNDPMSCYVWLHLFKKDFIKSNSLFFLEGKYFEDVAYTTESYLKAKRFMAIPLIYYIYRQHDNSIMATMNLKKIYSMNDIISYNYQLQFKFKLSPKALQKLYLSLYSSLIVNLWYLSHHRSLYPHRMEVINDLKKKVPNLFFNSSLKQRFVTFCYKYIPDLYIRIRYILAQKKYD